MRTKQPHHLHIGLRTVKTGLAVAISLLIASLWDAATPVYAAIGAISAMSRTLSDARQACMAQFAGIAIGCSLAYGFAALLPCYGHPAAIGFGLIIIIALCVYLRLDYAVSLSCVIFVSLCLDGENVFLYAVNRFFDTSTGLLVAYTINALVKPYNNRPMIERQFDAFLAALPQLLRDRVAAERYPDPEPLRAQLDRLHAELHIFEQQTFPHRKQRQGDSIYLRGCFQLAIRIVQEFDALCVMDVPGILAPETLGRLTARGIPMDCEARQSADMHSRVMNYHLNNLLDAWAYLEEMRREG